MARRIARRATYGSIPVLVALLALLSAGPAVASDLSPAQVHSQQWWITRLGLTDVWKTSQGAGVTVAVIDTGVNADFGDLRGAVLPGFNVGSDGNGQKDSDPGIHGTLIADEIAGRGTGFGLYGVARQAKILPVAIAAESSEALTTALEKLTAMADPPDIVNMSLGGPGTCPPDLQSAIVAASAKGMILVAAAGNTGDAGNPSLNPANCVGVIAVGAYDDNIQAWSGSQRQPYVSLSGPGVHMVGSDAAAASGYGYATGTSDAAAIVSGTFAVVRAKFKNASARDIVTRVLYTARQFLGAQGTRNSTWGFGVARPHHALTDAIPPSAPNPIYDALARLTGPSTPPSSASGDPSNPSAGPSVSGTTPTAGTITAPPQAGPASADGGSNTGLVVGIIVAVVVVLAVIVFLVLRGRRRPVGHGPGPDGPPWGGPPGGPGPGQW